MSDNMKLFGGIVTTAIISVGVTLGLVAPATEDTSDPSPIVVTATPLPQQPIYSCPQGWEIPEDNRDEHGLVYACKQGDWLVILDPATHAFERAWKQGVSRWVEDPAEVPGWPR